MHNYKLIRAHRSSISVSINRDGEIIVHAPRLMPLFFIERFLEEKREWIEKAVEKMHSHPKVHKREYLEDESFLFLGKEYPLHFGNYQEISLTDRLNVPQILKFRVQKELTNWYIKKAKEKITERVKYHAEKMGTTYTSLMFSDTISKWGSCTHDNRLQFRWRLIMAPLMVIDYVIIHELAHTIEHNHSNAFWAIVRKYTPAYRQHKKWLETNADLMVI